VLEILKRWWQWVVALAVVGGLYIAAATVNRVWLFWAFVGAGLLLAVGTVAARKGRSLLQQTSERLRKYPGLEAEVKVLRAELSSAQHDVAAHKERAVAERLVGIKQGRTEAMGMLQAHLATTPVLKAVVKRDQQLLLLAAAPGESPNRMIGALYFVKSTLTGEVKGMAKVISEGGASDTLLLECVQQRVIEFWKQLGASAEINPDMPRDIQLVPFGMPELNEIESIAELGKDTVEVAQ